MVSNHCPITNDVFLFQTRRQIDHINIRAGWMHYGFNSSKYLPQNNSKNHHGVGPRQVCFPPNNGYEETLEALKSAFFPNGKNFQGKISSMESLLGNIEGDQIPRDGFTECKSLNEIRIKKVKGKKVKQTEEIASNC